MNGWYFRLFPTTEDALRKVDFVSSYYTSPHVREAGYLGVSSAHLGLFVVDTGGGPRLMVGPVPRVYEAHEKLARRLTSASARKRRLQAAPWERSYFLPSTPAPRFSLRDNYTDPSGQRALRHLPGTSSVYRMQGVANLVRILRRLPVGLRCLAHDEPIR